MQCSYSFNVTTAMELLSAEAKRVPSTKHLHDFANFIRQNHLNDFVSDLIDLSYKYNPPIMELFSQLSSEQLKEMSLPYYDDLLLSISQNREEEIISKWISQWIKNELPVIQKHEVATEDITLSTHIRREVMINYIARYCDNVQQSLELVKEINSFFLQLDQATLDTYIDILNEEINKHVHFIERINNTTPGIVYTYDLESKKINYLNPKAEDLFGITKSMLEDANLRAEIVLQEDKQSIKGLFDRIRNNDLSSQPFSIDLRAKDINGNYRWLRNYFSIFRFNNDGKPTELIGMAIDIQEEKETAERLALREEELLQAQEIADMGSYIWNLDREEADVTPQVYHILGITKNKALRSFLSKVHIDDRNRVEQALKEVTNENSFLDCEFRYILHDLQKVIWAKGNYYEKDGERFLKGTLMDVTERHHIIERLKSSDELYKQAQAMTHIGNWVLEASTNTIHWTEELFHIYGIPYSTELKTDSLQQYNHPDDAEMISRIMEESAKTLKPYAFDYRIIRPDGQVRVLHAKGEVVADEHNNVLRMFGTVQDVTEQKEIEKQLLESKTFIQKIADATPSVIAAYNVHDGKYIFINKSFENILGYSLDRVHDEGVSFLISIIHPEDKERILNESAQALAFANNEPEQNHPMEFTYRLRHIDGSYHWFHTFGTVFERNSKGQVESILNISLDITDRVVAEKRVNEQRHFIEHITDASPTIIYLHDIEEKRIIYVNNEITALLGYLPSEIIDMGEEYIRIYHPSDLSNVEWKNQNIDKKRKGKVHQYECRIRNKNKKWRWFLVNEIAFTGENNRQQIIGAALDITERKEMENVLHIKTLELQQSNASLEEFAYVASHDLKEPLRKISAFGDRLINSSKNQLDDTGKTYLDKMISSSKRMQHMIDDLLALSMISAQKTFVPSSLDKLLEEVIRTLEIKIEEKNATIEFANLPELNVLPSQIIQLFQNLISNSLKFSHSERKTIIKIQPCDIDDNEFKTLPMKGNPKSFVRIDISDNGIGFENQFSDKIFSIFQRLHGRSQYEGTGIGLAICRKIAENHGGYITAEGRPGEGAVFHLYLPK